MIQFRYIVLFALFLGIFSCEPFQEEATDLPPLPEDPTFTVAIDTDNPNKVIVTSTANGFFDHLFSAPNGTPNSSELTQDTIFYPRAGTYEITLHASAIGGGGVSSSTQTVSIADDAEVECDANLSLLTDECTTRCWQLANTPGSISVGPTPLSGEWFQSSNLDPDQDGDKWCFNFTGTELTYEDNGATFSACAGYVAIPNYPVPSDMTWTVLPSGTPNSTYKIVLPDDFWMGVEDSGPEYEIISMTDTDLVVISEIKPCDGTPSPGWFTLTFIAQ